MGVTTGSISGLVTDVISDPLPGVVINAVHEPTGTQYTEVTQADARYAMRNVRVGGPYSMTATMPGFKTQKKDNLFVKLGEDLVVNFQLQISDLVNE